MDALSDVLRAVRLTGAIFFDVRASAPWVAETPPGAAIVKRIFPGASHLVSYHVITDGACWAEVDGELPMRLDAGDVIVFPHGDTHALASAPGLRQPPDLAAYDRPVDGTLPFSISVGSEGPISTQVVCGFLGCDSRPFNPLLSALPRVIRVSEREGGAIAAFVRFAVAEAHDRRPGGEAVLAERFTALVGQPPMQYLASWRMQLAATHLISGTDTVAAIAARVGYESEAAFSRTFKKIVGTSPAQWRRARAGSA